MGGGLLVDPAQPSQSVLYEKVTPTPPFGARMPLGKTPLDPATQGCLLAWVTTQAGGGPSGDAGGAVESGPVLDSGAALDAGRGMDSGMRVDSGGPTDAGAHDQGAGDRAAPSDATGQ